LGSAIQQFWRGNAPRTRPRAGRQRLLAATFVITAAAATAPAAQPAEGTGVEARQRLEALRERIDGVVEQLAADRGERDRTEARIEALDREIAELATALRRVGRRRDGIEEELARLEQRRGDLRRRLAVQQGIIADLAYSTYVMGRQNHLKLFLSQTDPAAINRMLGYHDYIVAARARAIERINEWASELEAVSVEARERREELDALAAEQRSAKQELESRRSERVQALAALSERIASSGRELERLRENESRLQRVLEELQAHLAEQAPSQEVEGAFREMKGRLRLPVSAPIDAGFGEPRNTGVRWDGVLFRPEAGAEVKSIFRGRVVFADWLRGFGLLLIVDHGDGYMSLYSHNQTLFKRVGDRVATGEVVATVGTSGGLDRPGLYFEIRNDGEPQNPLSWCQRS